MFVSVAIGLAVVIAIVVVGSSPASAPAPRQFSTLNNVTELSWNTANATLSESCSMSCISCSQFFDYMDCLDLSGQQFVSECKKVESECPLLGITCTADGQMQCGLADPSTLLSRLSSSWWFWVIVVLVAIIVLIKCARCFGYCR